MDLVQRNPVIKFKTAYFLLAFEEISEIVSGKVVPVGETDQQKVDFRACRHLLEHGDKLVAVDSSTVRWRLHGIKFL